MIFCLIFRFSCYTLGFDEFDRSFFFCGLLQHLLEDFWFEFVVAVAKSFPNTFFVMMIVTLPHFLLA